MERAQGFCELTLPALMEKKQKAEKAREQKKGQREGSEVKNSLELSMQNKKGKTDHLKIIKVKLAS